MKKIEELQQIKGDAYDYYIAGGEEVDLFEKIFLVDDIIDEICKPCLLYTSPSPRDCS